MNKPLKLLIAIAVLAFAAAGLYYAWMTPAGPATEPVEPREPKGASVPSRTPGLEAREEIVMGAGEMPTPVPVTPAAAGGPPTDAFAPSEPATVEGFVPETRPMRDLPASLPGFDPVPAGAASPSTTAASAPTGSVPSVPPASSAGTTASPTPGPTGSPAPSSLPSLPAAPPATTPVVPVPAPVTPAPPKPPEPAPQSYTVKEGDTVISIWRSLRGTERGWDALVSANPGLDPSRLKIGQVLKVPVAPAATVPSTTQPTVAGGAVAGSVYVVRSGDTLSTISAAAYGSARHWNLIHQANKSVIGPDPAALKVGMKLTLPPKPVDGVKSGSPAGGLPAPPSR